MATVYFQEPVSTTPQKLGQLLEEALANPHQISEEYTRRTFRLYRQLLAKFGCKARNFFAWHPLAKDIRNLVIPALLESSNEERLLRAASVIGSKRLTTEIQQQWKEVQEFYQEPLQGIDKSLVALIAINKFLQPYQILIVRVHSSNDPHCHTFAISKIVNEGVWELNQRELYFYQIKIMFPHLIPGAIMGSSDINLGLCWVDEFACEVAATRLLNAHQQERDFPMKSSLTKVMQKYPKKPQLAQAIIKDAICEEVKHRYNDLLYWGDSETRQDHARVFKERTQNHPLFHYFLNQCQTQEEQKKFFLAVEECNAKLASIAFGPDPHLALLLIENELKHGKRNGQLFPTEWEMVLSIMANNSDALLQGTLTGFMPYLMSSQSHLLRQQAASALQDIFHEDLSTMPFCELNEYGQLNPKSQTPYLLSTWREGGVPFWERVKQFLLS